MKTYHLSLNTYICFLIGEIAQTGKTQKFRSLFVSEEDTHKRPSDLEIRKKDLPVNQPTLGERMNRDVYRMFYQADEKHGYHNLRKYPDSMKDEVMETVKDELNKNPKKAFSDAFKTVRNEIRMFANPGMLVYGSGGPLMNCFRNCRLFNLCQSILVKK